MSLEPNEVDNVPGDTGQTMLYERYGQAIFGYLRLHAHSLEDAEDLLGRLRGSPSSGSGGSRASVPSQQPCLS